MWAEEICDVGHGIKSKSYLQATLAHQRSHANDNDLNIVTEIDPDACSRQGKVWKLEDQIYQQELLKCIFEYLRRGDMVGAYKVAKDSDEPWRAASTKGGVFYNSSGEYTSGNANRQAWKAVCYQIACQVLVLG